MLYTIVADTHIGSKYQVDSDIIDEVMHLPKDDNTILVGDIVDRTCAPKDNLVGIASIEKFFIDTHGDNYLDGNHEARCAVANGLFLRGLFFTHGDNEADPKKWRNYRASHKYGAGLFKRIAIMPFISLFNELVGGKPKEDFYKRAASRARMNRCHTYICGHFHPKKLIDTTYEGIRIIVVPQGITRIDL